MMRLIVAVALGIAVAPSAEAQQRQRLLSDEQARTDFYRTTTDIRKKLSAPVPDGVHPCRTLSFELELLGASYNVTAFTNPRVLKYETANLASLYLDYASAQNDRGCLYGARSTYLKVLTRFPGPDFAGYRQRAQVGIDDIRAATGGKPMDQLPWPTGSKF